MRCCRSFRFLAALAAILLAGCGSGGGPTAPPAAPAPPPAPVIRAPTSYAISSISVLGFNQNAPDGGDWDWALFVADRKPDISVALGGAAQFPIFYSDMRLNADYNRTYNFTQPASEFDGYLPRTLAYATAASVDLIDDDPGGDTVMATIGFRGSTLYQGDNATTLDRTLRGANGVVVRLRGSWQY